MKTRNGIGLQTLQAAHARTSAHLATGHTREYQKICHENNELKTYT